jgi:hypothetical protein
MFIGEMCVGITKITYNKKRVNTFDATLDIYRSEIQAVPSGCPCLIFMVEVSIKQIVN